MTSFDSPDTGPIDEELEIEHLRHKLAGLHDRLHNKVSSNQAKQNLVLILGSGMVVLVIVSMLALTKMTRQLDAEALAQIGRIQVQKNLPSGRRTVQDYLHREAPSIVGSAMGGLVQMLPRLRALLVKDLNAKVDVINAEFEQRIVARMVSAVHESKGEIDRAWPHASDEERLTRLVESVAQDFNTNIKAATTELYPHYAAEMAQIHAYLEDLSHASPDELSVEDRQRREIIETLLLLVAREKERRRREGHTPATAPAGR